MTQPWYDYPIPKAGSYAAGDDGDDIDAPDQTPLYFPDGGQVIDASYHVYGGQVVVHTQYGYDEYFIHLNNINVSPGQHVNGGDIIGDSGGGVGDLVLHNGVVQPAQDQSWYDGHSSGYHTEFGYFEDTSPNGDMGQFNKGWHNKSRQLDPTKTIENLRSGVIQVNPGHDSSLNAVNPVTGQPITNPLNGIAGALNGVNPANWLGDATKALGFSSPQNAMQRIAVGAVGVLVALAGLYVAGAPQINAAVQSAQANAVKAAKTTAKVAAL